MLALQASGAADDGSMSSRTVCWQAIVWCVLLSRLQRSCTMHVVVPRSSSAASSANTSAEAHEAGEVSNMACCCCLCCLSCVHVHPPCKHCASGISRSLDSATWHSKCAASLLVRPTGCAGRLLFDARVVVLRKEK
jgi:hypothetical protein